MGRDKHERELAQNRKLSLSQSRRVVLRETVSPLSLFPRRRAFYISPPLSFICRRAESRNGDVQNNLQRENPPSYFAKYCNTARARPAQSPLAIKIIYISAFLSPRNFTRVKYRISFITLSCAFRYFPDAICFVRGNHPSVQRTSCKIRQHHNTYKQLFERARVRESLKLISRDFEYFNGK